MITLSALPSAGVKVATSVISGIFVMRFGFLSSVLRCLEGYKCRTGGQCNRRIYDGKSRMTGMDEARLGSQLGCMLD